MAEDQGWYSEDAATFGDRLAGARDAAGMTQAALASRLGIKTAVVVAWEDDLKEPRANRLQMMSGILGVSMAWLLTGAGEGPDAPEDEGTLSNDVLDLLAEVRTLRSEILRSSEKLGRLEKRLRKTLKDDA